MKNVTYINAGAGSGKTYRLTETLTQLIADHQVSPDQVILTTFTTKAANDFKEKAKAKLFDKGLYREAIQLDHALIGTVHSVCQRMIGKYWFHLGLSPDMGVMAEEDSAFYISQSLAELPTDSELQLLHQFAFDFELHERTDNYVYKSTYDYDFWQGHLKRIIELATNYELDDFQQSETASLDYVRQFVREDVSISVTDDELQAMLSEARDYVQRSNRIKKKEDYLVMFDAIEREKAQHSIAWYKQIQSTFMSKYGPVCADVFERLTHLWETTEVYEKQEGYIRLLFSLARRWKENFAQFKRSKNLLDYNDMEKYMRLLLDDATVRSEISQSYRYLFVDEFQDSSPIQVKIFDALSDLMTHSYWVGDYKQAIYGFRGSDIALTQAVVDRVACGKDGCTTDTLDTSWRSLPDIVSVNNAVFEKTFADVLPKENIHLQPHRKNDTQPPQTSLRYFVSSAEVGIAEHIAKLLQTEDAQPSDICVLARTNKSLIQVANELTALGIPASREEASIVESATYCLVSSLLHIVDSKKDNLAKATVAYLTEPGYDTQRLIEAKMGHDANPESQKEDYLANVPLIRQLFSLQSRLQQQSVAAMVESLIIELNLYDVVKRMTDEPLFATNVLQLLIQSARTYEQHCVQMNLPVTIDGFLAYVEEVNPKGNGNPDGVQLHTYHSCKGLDWKYVILTSLNTHVGDTKSIMSNEMYGVHACHTAAPTADQPYPEVYVRLTPWIFGNANNVPNPISVQIEATEAFHDVCRFMLAEANRLLYVGMTRPADVLLLQIEPLKRGNKLLLHWVKDVGVDTVAESISEAPRWDVFGTGHEFVNFTCSEEEFEALMEDTGDEAETQDEAFDPLRMTLPVAPREEMNRAPRNISPSQIKGTGGVLYQVDFEHRIPFAKQPTDMATVGDCIHQIYAGIEEPSPNGMEKIATTIRQYQLQDVLADTDAIVRAWENLRNFLTETMPPCVKTYHERPFRLERDGQLLVGSIDLVWQTEQGNVVIDFKTCPMGAEAILDPESDHYAGRYAGQLDAYTDALEAAGEEVLSRFVYYPVSGLLVEVNRTEEEIVVTMGPSPDEENSLCLEVSDDVFTQFWLGNTNEVCIDVDQETQSELLENIDGHLVLNVEQLPDRYSGCHCWNEGKFPYIVNSHLRFVTLINQTRQLHLWISDCEPVVIERGERQPGGTFTPCSSGKDCIWQLRFKVFYSSIEGIASDDCQARQPNFYLLRWNPAISSVTLDRYEDEIVSCWSDEKFDWSVYEWEEARRGDYYFMVREGDDDSAGIVYYGKFESDPYQGADWARTNRPRHYCLYNIAIEPSLADGAAHLSLEQLEKLMPEINWRKGHSGEKITEEQGRKLLELLNR